MRFVKTAENLFGLPSGFTRTEYLQSTGTQYIDLGIGVKENTVFKATFSIASSGAGYSYFGARNSSNERFQIVNSIGIGAGYYLASSVYPIANQKYEIEMHANGDMYLDGVKRSASNGTFSQVTFDRNLWLFATNYYDSSVPPGASTFWKAQVFEGEILVRDMIPCLDPLGRACLYDLVDKKAYYNQGTGADFTVGRKIIPVEYLESSGTQYIDTGYKPVPATTKLEFCFSPTNISGNYFLFGARPDTAAVSQYTCTAYFSSGAVRQDWAGINASFPTTSIGNKYLYTAHNNTVSLNADTVTGTNIRSTTRSDYNFLLFTVNTAGTADSRRYIGRVYYAKLWDDGTLVRDFIPCKDENNVGFMFDTLSGTVYENAGTGAFAVGQNKYKMKLRLIKDNILPTGYTQVEYIEAENGGGSTVVQYAVGNYRLTDTTDWEITFSTEAPGNNWVLGQPTWIGVHYRKDTTTGNLPRVGITNAAASANQCYVDYTNNEKITLALKGTDVYANGVKVGSITRVSAPAAQTKFGIFAYKDINQELPNLRIQSARIYRLKIWDNGVLVQDLIPAIKDGVAGFYERVNKTFIEKESNSTSDFTTGKPVLPIVRFPVDPVPAGYKAVNYLESTGTQYIDTGVAGSSTLKIEMEGQKASAGYGVYFGAGTGNNRIQAIYINDYNNARIGNINNNLGLDAEKFNIVCDALNKNVIYNGTSYSFAYTSALTNLNIYLFTRNEGTTLADIATAKCWYCKIYDNNTLIRNFIPVIRLLDNKAGMWDTVTKQFYTTPVGDFITG